MEKGRQSVEHENEDVRGKERSRFNAQNKSDRAWQDAAEASEWNQVWGLVATEDLSSFSMLKSVGAADQSLE